MVAPRCAVITLVIYSTYVTTWRASADLQQESSPDLMSNLQLLQSLKDVDIDSLKNTISRIDGDLSDYQKRTCSFGLNSHHCALANLDNYLSAAEWLNTGHSPGKRSQALNNPGLREKYERVLEDIVKRRQNLAYILSVLDDAAGNKIDSKSKRTCRFNLGGTCATELASAIADQYYYLNGPSSPGKRRRRATEHSEKRLENEAKP